MKFFSDFLSDIASNFVQSGIKIYLPGGGLRSLLLIFAIVVLPLLLSSLFRAIMRDVVQWQPESPSDEAPIRSPS
jgi:hypothetical protein